MFFFTTPNHLDFWTLLLLIFIMYECPGILKCIFHHTYDRNFRSVRINNELLPISGKPNEAMKMMMKPKDV